MNTFKIILLTFFFSMALTASELTSQCDELSKFKKKNKSVAACETCMITRIDQFQGSPELKSILKVATKLDEKALTERAEKLQKEMTGNVLEKIADYRYELLSIFPDTKSTKANGLGCALRDYKIKSNMHFFKKDETALRQNNYKALALANSVLAEIFLNQLSVLEKTKRDADTKVNSYFSEGSVSKEQMEAEIVMMKDKREANAKRDAALALFTPMVGGSPVVFDRSSTGAPTLSPYAKTAADIFKASNPEGYKEAQKFVKDYLSGATKVDPTAMMINIFGEKKFRELSSSYGMNQLFDKKLASVMDSLDTSMGNICIKKGKGLEGYDSAFEGLFSKYTRPDYKEKKKSEQFPALCLLKDEAGNAFTTALNIAAGGLMVLGVGVNFVPVLGQAISPILLTSGAVIFGIAGSVDAYNADFAVHQAVGVASVYPSESAAIQEKVSARNMTKVMLVANVIPGSAVPKKAIVAANTRQMLKIEARQVTSDVAKATRLRSNKAFIRSVETAALHTGEKKGFVYIIRNEVLKSLNDKIFKDKDLVTAIHERYISIFKKNIESSSLSGIVNVKVIENKLEDFRSLSLEFSENSSPAIIGALDEIAAKTSMDLSKTVDDLGKSLTLLKARGIEKDPAQWYLAGAGKTIDEASFAVGMARGTVTGRGPVATKLFDPKDVAKISESLEKSQLKMEQAIASDPVKKALFHQLDNGHFTLKEEVIELVRKYKGDRNKFFDNFRTHLGQRFPGVKISQDEAETMLAYYHNADRFGAQFLIPERVVIDMGASTHGNLSFDIVGMGATNMSVLMKELAGKSYKNGDDLIKLGRTALTKADEAMEKIRLDIRGKSEAVIPELKSRPGLFKNTGDDVMSFPAKALTHEDRAVLVKSLSSAEKPANFRVVTLPQNYAGQAGAKGVIEAELRSRMIVKGELFEKALRAELEGSAHLSYEQLNKVAMLIDLSPKKVLLGAKTELGFNLMVAAKGLSADAVKAIEVAAQKIAKEKGLKFQRLEVIP